MLHIINKSPFEKDAFTSAVAHAAPGSTFLLIEDAVYAGLTGTAINDTLQQAMGIGKVVALSSDVKARGIGDKLADGVEQTDYAGFVDLVAESDNVQSWL